MSPEIEEKLFNIVAETLRVEPTALSLDTTSDNLEQWDSLGHLRLVMALEDEFNFKFPTDEIAHMTKLQDSYDRVARRHG